MSQIMPDIEAAIRRHPVLIYFALVFIISGGGILLVVGPRGFPLDATRFASFGPMLYAASLAGPCVAGILLTVLIDGRTGLRNLIARLGRWPTGWNWYASLMFLYIYNDYFGLYSPGKIASITAGRIGPFEANEPAMVVFSILLSIPALMIFLSAVLPPAVNRWLNILLGLVYTVVEVLTLIGSRLSYQIVVSLEIVVTLLIIWFALRWPKHGALA
jgi:hypothetical protein